FLPADVQADLRARLGAEVGDLLLIVADTEDVVCAALGALRVHLAGALRLYTNWWERRAAEEEAARQAKRRPEPFQFRPDDFKLAWVVDFPLFTWDEEEKR